MYVTRPDGFTGENEAWGCRFCKRVEEGYTAFAAVFRPHMTIDGSAQCEGGFAMGLIEADRIERDPETSEPWFIHAADCPNFCEYACGGQELPEKKGKRK